MTLIYKLMTAPELEAARASGRFEGSAVDLADGFIHFSGADQLAETARRYFSQCPDLICLAVDTDGFGAELRWEPSRGGALFPHLYRTLDLAAVRRTWKIPLYESGEPDVGRVFA